MPDNQYQAQNLNEAGENSDLTNIDKDEYINTLEISIQVLQKEIEKIKKRNYNKESPKTNQDFLSAIANKLLENQSITDFLKSFDLLLNEEYDTLESSFFELNKDSNLIPLIYDENYLSFYQHCNYLQEDGIINWVIKTNKLQVIPNLRDSNYKIDVFTIIYCLEFSNSLYLFVAKTKLPSESLNEQMRNSLMAGAKLFIFLYSLTSSKNKSLVSSLNDINILDEINFKLHQCVHYNILSYAKIIESNAQMLDSGIGDKKRRIDIITLNSNKIRETEKKFLHLIENNDGLEKKVNLHNLIENLIFLLDSQLLNLGISIKNELDKELEVKHSSHLVKTLFFELISTSMKTLEDGGKIIFDSKILNNAIIINIQDTGFGLPSEECQAFNENRYFNAGYNLENMKRLKETLEENKIKFEINSKEMSGTGYSITFQK